MGDTKKYGNQGVTFVQALTITFIALKLCDVIDWSWWWVLSPLWLGIALLFTVLSVFFVIILIVGGRSER